MDVLVERCAGLDVGKDEVVACVRTPGERGRRQETRTFLTFTSRLEALADWLAAEQVSQVVMEATGSYWKPVWYVLSERGFDLLLVNAAHVKIVPGRKSDVADAAWLAQLLEHGLLRGSFVPPRQIAQLRDLTRYRKRMVQAHTAEAQRIAKTLEDAGIKLDSVASTLLGVSSRAMLHALVDGQRDPRVLAELAKGKLRAKLPALTEALHGRFADHHAMLIGLSLDHLEYLEAAIDTIDGRVQTLMRPFAKARDHLVTITGIAQTAATTIIAEIGVDMSVFPTAAHLASWARVCPGTNITGGKRKSGYTGGGNPWLRDVLVQCAWAASRSRDTYLAAQYWRLARRIGKKKAALAVAHSILVIAWHLLTNDTDYTDLGGDYFTHHIDNTPRRRDRLIHQLEAMGYTITVEQTAA